jgi:molecular chaperone DnaK
VTRSNIDIGIDLGTTNSAVAVIQQGTPFIISDDPSRPLTPSVVRINSSGVLTVGNKAYDMLLADEDNTVGRFKRWMGTNEVKRFRDSGRELTAPQLSAEVLKVLRGYVQRQLGEATTAAVITVPAAFEVNQCFATQEAARLAGIEHAPLLQEPVAASLAYGYRIEMERQNWLVYDLGGGTFDLALVGVRDGQVKVLDHEGDNFLGGTDLDWLLVEQIMLPRLAERFNIGSFSRANPERRSALQVLKGVAETAKIELSRADSAIATIETYRKPMLDDDGREVEADIIIAREEYEAAIGQFVARTVGLSQALLDRHPGTAVRSVLMVGGPTLTPFIRTAVGNGLGVDVNTAANPLTVVAEGAALYAASQPLPILAKSPPGPSSLTLDLKYPTVTDDDSALIGAPVPSEIVTLEYAAADGSWSSGQLPVANGRCVTRLPLPRKGAHEFRLIARAVDGRILACEPPVLTITRGLTAAAPPLPRPIGVVVEDGTGDRRVKVIIPKNVPLPARGTAEFRTAIALEPGGEMEVIAIHVVEGESARPERNRHIGELIVTDRDVSRVIPAGNPIEVTIEVSESRLLTASAYMPLIDRTFSVELARQPDEPDAADLRHAVLLERERLAGIAEHLPTSVTREMHEDLREVESDVHVAQGGDPDSGQKALRNLQRVQMRFDAFEDSQRLPRAIADARAEAELATSVVMDYRDDSQKARLRALLVDVDQAVASNSVPEIRRAEARLERLRFEILTRQPGFWLWYFERLCEDVKHWTDRIQAESLMRQGRAQILREDYQGLSETCLSLRLLVQPDDLARVDRFHNVGIRES